MLNPNPPAQAAEYNRIAASFLRHPPDPKLSALAVAWYRRSLEVEPNWLKTHLALAQAYHQIGQLPQAWDCCDKAENIEPESLIPAYYRCMLQLPILYRQKEEVSQSRQQYQQQLIALGEKIDRAIPEAIAALAYAVGRIAPFYLAYQGQDDLDLMGLYGQLITQIMAARYPQWAQSLPSVAPKPNEAIRVGIVSGHFYRHSIWKDILKGWIAQLDRQKFHLIGYALNKTQDEETEFARNGLAKFVTGSHTTEEWGKLIQADYPHILLYPEVSMTTKAIQLSALRLAPVQATTWATYVTSGLPTIDYFLTGALIEPKRAEEQYLEKLVRLPNLGMYYTPLQETLASEQRNDFGLRPSAIVYFCAQSLFKYLPQYDWLYPYIARAVGDCQFIFMKHKTSEAQTKILSKRLQNAFAAEGLDLEQYVVMQPAVSNAGYSRLNDLADIFLDSIGVAGTTTTLEAIAHNLPIVTLTGEFLRGRVSSGILQKMEVTETIATSPEDYVAIAIRLGTDAAFREQVRARIAANKHKIYADTACIEGLEDFLEHAVRGEN
ncbi:MAG: hypothetical protein J7545_23030 [Roseofilum sp. SBFL]|uniref:O-linked N-acetylglucosamine transferase, SPINDLY family protein n=1 Tax=unclassified Roseofilum TaxID=2620099 RepID=UPI001B208ED6|nr:MULTISPECIES: hypothetical protein [unclassified Roseofilum]MBP0011903.1 hypothetical protein [Roseofilum sp. SID3]MBP0022459.1 hypothetical protein [Roseofilum sp. SID2]MBP0037401.1 hypothetical protein [Roseofilum sp. SID1]MBP0044811.1 hypothetical protein [Roseofilum sp. SBFL]